MHKCASIKSFMQIKTPMQQSAMLSKFDHYSTTCPMPVCNFVSRLKLLCFILWVDSSQFYLNSSISQSTNLPQGALQFVQHMTPSILRPFFTGRKWKKHKTKKQRRVSSPMWLPLLCAGDINTVFLCKLSNLFVSPCLNVTVKRQHLKHGWDKKNNQRTVTAFENHPYLAPNTATSHCEHRLLMHTIPACWCIMIQMSPLRTILTTPYSVYPDTPFSWGSCIYADIIY